MIPKHECFTVQEDVTLKDALDMLEKHQIDGLPVLRGEVYLGVVTRYNIYESYFLSNKDKEEYLNSTFVKDALSYQGKFLQGGEIFEKTLIDLKRLPIDGSSGYKQ